ncbi:MAG: hypothetical protein H7268_00175 [Sandarakinorhabdus sp.]|nr:hypothetical protein [Sandarakinorhabdus sp.]
MIPLSFTGHRVGNERKTLVVVENFAADRGARRDRGFFSGRISPGLRECSRSGGNLVIPRPRRSEKSNIATTPTMAGGVIGLAAFDLQFLRIKRITSCFNGD